MMIARPRIDSAAATAITNSANVCPTIEFCSQAKPTNAFQRALSRLRASTRSAMPGKAAPHHPRSGKEVQVRAPPATDSARHHQREGGREDTAEDYVRALIVPAAAETSVARVRPSGKAPVVGHFRTLVQPARLARVSFVPDDAVMRRSVRFLLNTRA